MEESGACGRIGARGKDPRRRALPTSPRHHGELVRPGRSAVIQVIGGGAGLEGPTLALRGVCWVGRGEVGVVAASGGGRHGGCHGEAQGAVGAADP